MSALKKVKLPNNTTVDINDARVVSDGITYIGDVIGYVTYEADGVVEQNAITISSSETASS